MRAVSLIEPLEDRIAPAAVVAISTNGKSATYTDATGDTVVVTTTKGNFNTATFTFDPSTTGQLTELSVANNTGFNGASINFTVFPVSGSSTASNAVNVGYIDAIGVGLASLTIPGDLGRIDAGGGASATALGKLTVNSLGALSTTQGGLTIPNGGTLDVVSNLTGAVGQVNIAGNLDGTLFAQDFNSHPGTGNIGQLNVGGSINGNVSHAVPNATNEYVYTAGQVIFTGSLGTAVIGGGLEGGPGEYSGSIGGYSGTSGGLGTFSKIGSVTVKGSVPDDPSPAPAGSVGTSILGGTGAYSGGIIADTVGSVTVAGDVLGGAGTGSGFVQGALYLKTVNINGSLLGGNFDPGSPSEANSSGVVAGATIGSVTIGKNLYGGSGIGSGEIFSTGTIQKVLVMGDLGGGTAGTSSNSGLAGVIHGKALGSITVMGSVTGGNLVAGDPNQLATGGASIIGDATIGTVYIGGNVTGGSGAKTAQILTGAGNATSITIAGTSGLTGGAGASSGEVNIAGNLGSLLVKSSVTGGTGSNSGFVATGNNLGSLSIGGSLAGGASSYSGNVAVFGTLSRATISKVQGSSNTGKSTLTNTGYIQANAIGTMTVGSLISGSAVSGDLDTSGAIRATTTISSITIGTLQGTASNPAIISAVGPANVPVGATSDVAIGSITIKTGSSYGDILAGYNTNTNGGTTPLGTGANADAQIGTVTIGGGISATNIIAGVGTGTGGLFGNATSAALSGAGVTDLPTIVSKISRIVINGGITGPGTSTTDTYGIAAQYIATAIINGTALKLKAGADNDTFANGAQQALLNSGNGNTTLYEV
jgi:hypothetical protein